MDLHEMDLHEEAATRPKDVPTTCDVSDNNHSNHGEDEIERGNWGSQVQYLLTVVGYCVGLSNVLRFPYLCNTNGGGAFLIPYITCLLLCGLPLFFLEVVIGQFHGKGAVHVWSVCPLMTGLGIGMLIISGGVIVYYSTTCAWVVYYTFYSCRTVLPWTSCDNTWNTESCVENIKLMTANSSTVPNVTKDNETLAITSNHHAGSGEENETLFRTAAEEFWQRKVLSISSGLDQLGGIKWELALCLLVTWIFIFGSLAKGIKTIGKVVYVTATLPYAFLFILLVRGLTLPGGPQGILFFITPDFSKLLDVQVWVGACVQVFFSLGPGYGGLISMASYNTFHSNCLRNALICTLVCGGSSLFAGLVVFSFLGSMAHDANVPITDVLSSGPGLGFVIYPEALAQLPLPQIWSVFFFVMLILLVQDSLFSTVETVISAILDQFPFLLKWRIPVTAAYCAMSFLLGLMFITEGGMYIYQLVDWYLATLFLISAGFLECIILGWVYGVNRVSADVELMTGKPVPVFFRITWCYITPTLLLTIFIFTLAQYQPPTYGSYIYPDYAASFGWCLAVIPCIPLVVVMCMVIYKEEGTILQRLKKTMRPDSSWGPAKSSYRELYCHTHTANS